MSKPEVWTDGTKDYKLMVLNDERITQRWVVASRPQGNKCWDIVDFFYSLFAAKHLLMILVKDENLTRKA